MHTVVITGTQPDAPYILDGLLDPQTSVRPREIMTDTAGYTDVIFGLFRLLGYQYSPRLADAGGATFWRINPTDHGPLNTLARHQVNTRLVEQHYDACSGSRAACCSATRPPASSSVRCAATPDTSLSGVLGGARGSSPGAPGSPALRGRPGLALAGGTFAWVTS